MRLSPKKSEAGFSLVEALVVTGIMSILATGALSIVDSMHRERARLNLTTTLQTTRDKLYSLLESNEAWQATVAGAPSLRCLHENQAPLCQSGLTTSPIVRNQVGTAYFDPNSQGFDTNGNICSQSNGSNSCPIRYAVVTKLSCGTVPTCIRPAIVTSVTLKILANPMGLVINTARFDFESFHGSRGPASVSPLPTFSKDCVDWAANGWDTREACLKDGRWHLAYSNNKAGASIAGSINALKLHVGAGAEVKVKWDDNNQYVGAGFEKCQSAYISISGKVYCLSATRFAGETDPGIVNGSARYASDGTMYCISASSGSGSSGNACPGWRNNMEWYVRY